MLVNTTEKLQQQGGRTKDGRVVRLRLDSSREGSWGVHPIVIRLLFVRNRYDEIFRLFGMQEVISPRSEAKWTVRKIIKRVPIKR